MFMVKRAVYTRGDRELTALTLYNVTEKKQIKEKTTTLKRLW